MPDANDVDARVSWAGTAVLAPAADPPRTPDLLRFPGLPGAGPGGEDDDPNCLPAEARRAQSAPKRVTAPAGETMTTTPVRPVDAQHDVSWSLTVSEREIERWRRRVAGALGEWRASREAVELARLGVSELLANVGKHTGSRRCCLRVVRVGADVVVQVFDESKCLPVLRTPDWCSEDGRGLWLLREMADGFGFMPVPWGTETSCRLGKVVWFSCWGAVPEAGVA